MTIDVVQVRNNAYVARDTDTKGNVVPRRSTNSHSVSPLEFEMYRLEEVLHVFVAFMIDRGVDVGLVGESLCRRREYVFVRLHRRLNLSTLLKRTAL